MTAESLADRRQSAARRLRELGIILSTAEAAAIEIADFGLGRFAEFGLAVQVYVNTSRCCAKELVMLPGQICPEHRHPPVGDDPGKEETFRVRAGSIELFVPGPDDPAARTLLPPDKRHLVTVSHRIQLAAGGQYTLAPDTRHWFVAGPDGAVVSEFSTCSRDAADIFTDPAIIRLP
jgi:D-lyxose ketol-isomerase